MGIGTVLKMPTHGIPVPNTKQELPSSTLSSPKKKRPKLFHTINFHLSSFHDHHRSLSCHVVSPPAPETTPDHHSSPSQMAGIQDDSVNMIDGGSVITHFDVNRLINESSGDNVDTQPW